MASRRQINLGLIAILNIDWTIPWTLNRIHCLDPLESSVWSYASDICRDHDILHNNFRLVRKIELHPQNAPECNPIPPSLNELLRQPKNTIDLSPLRFLIKKFIRTNSSIQ